MTRMIETLDSLAGDYAAILCDVWGVIHNGERTFPEAVAALRRARGRGVAVVLLTNAPRPWPAVSEQLEALGVPEDAWDAMVTSGDVTRDLIAAGSRRVFHLGPERDALIYDGLDVELVEEFEASTVVCTGLLDDTTETPEDYADMLRRMRGRDLPFICANPDIVVERGDTLIWCAGALARDYAGLGGRTAVAGKPHRPIYDAAFAELGRLMGREPEKREVLAIGDGVLTDVKGAAGYDLDIVYVSGGIHAGDYGPAHAPDPHRLAAFLDRHGYGPAAVIPHLA